MTLAFERSIVVRTWLAALGVGATDSACRALSGARAVAQHARRLAIALRAADSSGARLDCAAAAEGTVRARAERRRRGEPNVTLVVVALKTADGKSRLLRIVSPLNVLLPAGLGLRIDQTDVGNTGFVRCLPNGCVAEVIMDDDLIRQLKSGSVATFIIFEKPEEGIGIPVSLNGFGEGFDSLP